MDVNMIITPFSSPNHFVRWKIDQFNPKPDHRSEAKLILKNIYYLLKNQGQKFFFFQFKKLKSKDSNSSSITVGVSFGLYRG